MTKLFVVLFFAFFSSLVVTTSFAQTLETSEDAFQYIKDRLVYIEGRTLESYETCPPTKEPFLFAPQTKGTGLLLNDRYVLTALHVIDALEDVAAKKSCFLVYRETDRSKPIAGTLVSIAGTNESRFRIGAQDLGYFRLGNPVADIRNCPPIAEQAIGDGDNIFFSAYRGDEIDLAGGQAIGTARKFRRPTISNCERAGICEAEGQIAGGHSGAPVIDDRGQLVGVLKGDEAEYVLTKFEPTMAVRPFLLSLCGGQIDPPLASEKLYPLNFLFPRANEMFGSQREFTESFDALEGHSIERATFVGERDHASEPVIQISDDGQRVTVSSNLERGTVVNRFDGKLVGHIVTLQVPRE